ncbi:hypothetical protein M378DRAFT_82799 [Amanita muscaria Koide BX008]|uniref:Uncharacterized protein n=1 Tax=Amanita muscaria (strain Koide BX008) TaxID=946122 RepID=A0A0C2SDS6_AMAMK|nr:hypothetical protein M378DRAFT_82799 [Amanita muscaria Koide BX008]
MSNPVKSLIDSASKIIGEVRTLSDAEKDLPSPKKPRVDTKHASRKGSGKKKTRRKDRALPEKYSAEDVLWQDVVSVLGGRSVVDNALEEGSEFDSPYDTGDVLEVEIVSLSSTGEFLFNIGLHYNLLFLYSLSAFAKTRRAFTE